jgi:hypothetical protein
MLLIRFQQAGSLFLIRTPCSIESEVLGRVLAAERVSWREGSAQAWDRFARVLGRAGNMQGALEAGQAAHALGEQSECRDTLAFHQFPTFLIIHAP